MRKNHVVSRERLLASIEEAEELATHIDTLEDCQEKMRLTFRWAAMVDEAAMLMVQIEEQFSEEELTALQNVVNEHDKSRWDNYRRNIKWMNKPAE